MRAFATCWGDGVACSTGDDSLTRGTTTSSRCVRLVGWLLGLNTIIGDVASSAEAQELVTQMQGLAREKREALEAKRREERTLRCVRPAGACSCRVVCLK